MVDDKRLNGDILAVVISVMEDEYYDPDLTLISKLEPIIRKIVKEEVASLHTNTSNEKMDNRTYRIGKEATKLIETHLEEVKEFIEKNYFKDHAKM